MHAVVADNKLVECEGFKRRVFGSRFLKGGEFLPNVTYLSRHPNPECPFSTQVVHSSDEIVHSSKPTKLKETKLNVFQIKSELFPHYTVDYPKASHSFLFKENLI